MALTRGLLKALGLTDEPIQEIIDAHRETVDGLKKEVEKYKEAAEKLPDVQKELDDLKKSGGDWQKKYDDEHKAFEEYKAGVDAKELAAKMHTAYRKLLTENKVGEKHIDSILKVTDFSGMKLKDDGTFENADKLTDAIKKDWAGFITETQVKGANVETPPKGNEGNQHKPGRAAELAKAYHEGLYGAMPSNNGNKE